jgi:glycosidase
MNFFLSFLTVSALLFFGCNTAKDNNSGFPDAVSKNYEGKYALIFKKDSANKEQNNILKEMQAELDKLNFLYKQTHFGNQPLQSDSFIISSLAKTISDTTQLEFYKEVLKIKNQHPVLMNGLFTIRDEKNKHILAFTAADDNEELITILNMNEDNRSFAGNYPFAEMELLLCNYEDGALPNLSTSLLLRPFEARIYKVR